MKRKHFIRAIVREMLYRLDSVGLVRWPGFLNLERMSQLLQSLTVSISAKRLSKFYQKNPVPVIPSSIANTPLLEFNALYSYQRLSRPTPCATALARDLASCVDLRSKKILALGARNTIELDQLVLFGANGGYITAVDLYSSLPQIVAMDFHNLDFPDETFDIVFWAGSFAYAEKPNVAAAEALRVLKKDGYLAVGDTLVGNPTLDWLNSTILDSTIEKRIRESLDKTSESHTMFTHQLESLETLLGFFVSQNDFLVLTRKYPPSHVNFILRKG